ncbi:MAG: hypothetical protein WCI55_11600 [Armatimonadota bacterium]
MKIQHTLVVALCAMSTLVYASAQSKISTTFQSPGKGAANLKGSGSSCLAGCTENDHCISADRMIKYNPHFECRFDGGVITTCTNTMGNVWCNRTFSTCSNPTNQLDETTSGKCAAGVPPRDPA